MSAGWGMDGKNKGFLNGRLIADALGMHKASASTERGKEPPLPLSRSGAPTAGGHFVEVRHETIPGAGSWTPAGAEVLAVPYLKLAQVLLLAGAMALGGGVNCGDDNCPEIDGYLENIYRGRISTESLVADAVGAKGRAGWKRHSMLVVGFSVLSASVCALRRGAQPVDCSNCGGESCPHRERVVGI